jgi:hypothetical protein
MTIIIKENGHHHQHHPHVQIVMCFECNPGAHEI